MGLVLTWTAQETFCKPSPGSQTLKELNTDPVDVDKFRQDSLTAHNSYRAKHGVAALKINAELNALAQEWADHLIAEGTFEHRPTTTTVRTSTCPAEEPHR